MFAVTVLLLVPTLAFLYLSSHPGNEDGQIVAQFEDAFPLVEGMNVRVDGAIAGSVGKISVNDEGIAEVRLLLDEGAEPPRADATAAIRQQDTTGDSYVAFEPGESRKPLPEIDGDPTIACDGEGEALCPHTLVAPRLDDLLNTFGRSERTGIHLTLTELARAVDGRGKDLNRAALDLRPGLAAANRALADVNSQNAALRAVIADAEAVTSQAADRRTDLVRSIDSLAATLQVTAQETGSLDAGLERLPATVRQGRSTMAALGSTAIAARPLAADLREVAPKVVTATERAPAFVADLRSFLTRARPTLVLTHRLLKAAAPTIEAGPSRVVTGPFDLAPAISNLLRGVLGEDETIEVLFNEKFGLGAASSEPGNQPGYPAEAADRRFMRVTAILNCEGFGVEVGPGCLVNLLDLARTRDARSRSKRDGERARDGGRRGRDDERSTPSPQPAGNPPTPAPAPSQPGPAPATPAAPSQPAAPAPAPATPPAPSGPNLDPLLDFLLGR
jgi:virulence factor Mce-like protein